MLKQAVNIDKVKKTKDEDKQKSNSTEKGNAQKQHHRTQIKLTDKTHPADSRIPRTNKKYSKLEHNIQITH